MSRRLMLVLIALVVAAAAVAACSPLTLLSAATPSGDLREDLDLAYGNDARHRLDVAAPRGNRGSRPVVVFFYGGAWQGGERAQYRFAARALAERGIVAVVPDYRVYPAARFPDFLHDCAAAVRWARDNAARYGGDPNRLFVMGHSAGAYNAAMLALDGRWLHDAGLDPKRDLAGWIGLSGPYDFLPIVDPVVQTVFGPRDTWPATQPIAYVSAGAPRALLITGNADTRVRPGNSVRLADALQRVGVPVQLITYPEIGHARTLVALSPWLRGDLPVLEAVTAFVGEDHAEGAPRARAEVTVLARGNASSLRRSP